jgi:6-phosphogluconate dehydrogenase
MQIGMVGLGRMGGNMARRLARGGLQVVAWDRSEAPRAALADEPGVQPVATLQALVAALAPPRAIWLMLPAGGPSEQVLGTLAAHCGAGDLLVDGANAHYADAQRHAATLAARGLEFVDAGVSGGIWGLQNGYGLMVGGSEAAVARLAPALRALAPAPDEGWLHCGAAGAGHYAKMVHNGIEYGLMQAYAEGLALLEARPDLGLDVAKLAEHWRHGTVIRSWLLDLTAEFLAQDAKLLSAWAGLGQSQLALRDAPGAIASFGAFVKARPKSPLAPSAQYWIGNAQFARRDYRAAIAAQRQLVQQYPDSAKVPDALLNIASAQGELNENAAARRTLEELIAKYPSSEAAAKAKQRLGVR